MISKNIKENQKKQKDNEVKKIVPSKLENAFYPIVYNTFGKIKKQISRRNKYGTQHRCTERCTVRRTPYVRKG